MKAMKDTNFAKPYNLIKVYSRDRKEFGFLTRGLPRRCIMEGCSGVRLGVRWSDGKLTFPCTSGMKQFKNGNKIIL